MPSDARPLLRVKEDKHHHKLDYRPCPSWHWRKVELGPEGPLVCACADSRTAASEMAGFRALTSDASACLNISEAGRQGI